MNVSEARKSVVIVASALATISAVDGVTGEVLFTEGLKVGRHNAAQWIPYMTEGSELEVSEGATLIMPSLGRHTRMKYGDGSHDTGANPVYKPTKAQKMEQAFDLQMKRLALKGDKMERQMKRLAQVEVVDHEAERADKLAAEVEAKAATEAAQSATEAEAVLKAEQVIEATE